MARRSLRATVMGDGEREVAAEVEVAKTEVEEVKVAAKVELDIALRMDLRRSREGKGRSAVGGSRTGGVHLGRKRTTSRSTRWWLGTRAQPLATKRECLWSVFSLTSSRDRYALNK